MRCWKRATAPARSAAVPPSPSACRRRVFTDPLARALIEQRQILATGTREDRRRVAIALDAFTIAPERFYDGKNSLYLSLRAAYWGTRLARDDDSDITHVEDLLWQIAVSLEQNGMMAAAE